MSSERWKRTAPLRCELFKYQIELEVVLNCIEELADDPRLPSHVQRNIRDLVDRTRDDAHYLQEARRGLR